MARIVGLGELLVDAHYAGVGNTYRYDGSRGGGSVWNTLANAATQGADCLAVAHYAKDWRSEVAKGDLESLGVDVEARASGGSLPTPVMHHMPLQAPIGRHRNRYRTSSNCPVCVSRTQAIDIDRVSSKFPVRDILGAARGDILVVDGLSHLRTDWAATLKGRGWLTVADIGYSRFLRYQRRNEIRDKLGSFGLLVMQRQASDFLTSRLEVTSVAEVAELLEVRIVVSDGENGLEVHDAGSVVKIEAPSVKVADSVGAGDALLGNLLARLSRVRTAASASHEELIAALEQSVELLPSVLSQRGARGHLPTSDEFASFGPRSGQSLEELRELTHDAVCVMCGHGMQVGRGRKTTRSGANSSNLRSRVIAAASSRSAVTACRRQLERAATTVVCASGGSYPAARIIADSLNQSGSFAVAMKPLDVLMTLPKAERIVGVSYSGGSSDTIQALAAMHQRYHTDQVLITRLPRPGTDPSGSDIEVISYGLSSGGSRRQAERGFVAMAAAVSPVAVWAAAATDSDSVVGLLRDSDLPAVAAERAAQLVQECALRDRALGILGTGWATGAMLDLESKITEAGLGQVALHEAKDFSHGRFMSVVGERATAGGILHLGVGSLGFYEQQLIDVLTRRVEVASLLSTQPGILGALELLYAVQRFSSHYAHEQGVDMSHPGNPPEEFLSLYRWTSGLGAEGSVVLDS